MHETTSIINKSLLKWMVNVVNGIEFLGQAGEKLMV